MSRTTLIASSLLALIAGIAIPPLASRAVDIDYVCDADTVCSGVETNCYLCDPVGSTTCLDSNYIRYPAEPPDVCTPHPNSGRTCEYTGEKVCQIVASCFQAGWTLGLCDPIANGCNLEPPVFTPCQYCLQQGSLTTTHPNHDCPRRVAEPDGN